MLHHDDRERFLAIDLLEADRSDADQARDSDRRPNLPNLDERLASYSIWPALPGYTPATGYHRETGHGDHTDYASSPAASFRSNAQEVWIRPMQRVVQLPPEWVGKGVRGYCIPTMNTEVSWLRNNDPDPWRVNTHEYFHFNYLGGGDGSEGYVRFLERLRLGDEPRQN